MRTVIVFVVCCAAVACVLAQEPASSRKAGDARPKAAQVQQKQAPPEPQEGQDYDPEDHVAVMSSSDGSDSAYEAQPQSSLANGTAESGIPRSYGTLKSAFQQSSGVTMLVFEDSGRSIRMVSVRGSGRRATWELETEIRRTGGGE